MATRLVRSTAIVLTVLGGVRLAAQVPLALDETRPFFQDVGGYHAQGEGQAQDRAEAQRLAKAAALSRLFKEIGKDAIFAEMAISGWPEYITVEDTTMVERDGVTTALVQVAVAMSAIMMTDQKYQVAVAELLTRAETALGVVEDELEVADEHERNLRVSEAIVSYRRSRSRAAEARELTRNIGDRSAASDMGNTIAAITARLDAAELRIADGLDRMETIENETLRTASADEMTRAVDLYETEIRDMEERNQINLELSPFYDLPRAELEGIVAELQADRAKTQTVLTELERIAGLLPVESQYLRQRTDLSLSDARALSARLERMEEEAQAEIRLPRLVRQERAQRRRAVAEALGAGVRYAFLHKPTDTVWLDWVLPLRWDMENPVQGTGELDLGLDAEGVFGRGFWVHGSLGYDTVVDTVGPTVWRSGALQSSFDMGFGATTMLGLGLLWDWKRFLGQDGIDGEREIGVRLHLGGVDTDRRRVSWLISLGYAVPTVPAGEILIPYHLNVWLSVKVKAGDVLILRAHLRSRSYQSAPLEGAAFTDAYTYRFDWNAGVGLRLPPPFVLGIAYGGQVTAGLTPGGVRDADPYVGGWTVSLGYVF